MFQRFNYREFTKQWKLLEEYKKLTFDERDKTILMGCDIDIYGHMKEKGLKKYAMIYYSKLFGFISTCSEKTRCYYELIKVNEFCKMYFDIDGVMSEHNKPKMEYMLNNFHKDFYLFWEELKMSNEGGCFVIRNHNQDKTKMPETMNIYTSSNERKISYHFIFHDLVMQNHFHCGAVLRRLELWILDKFGEDIDKNPYFFMEEDGNFEFALDRGVYTTHRLMRILYNTKGGQKRFLKPDRKSVFIREETKFSLIQFEEAVQDIFMNSFLQNISLNNTEYFSCCEVRSFAFYENMRNLDHDHDDSHDDHHNGDNDRSMSLSMNQLEWIEPSKIGHKVISMTPFRLRRLKMIKYIKKAEIEGGIIRNPFSENPSDYQFYMPQIENSFIGCDSPEASLSESGAHPLESEKRLNNMAIVSESLEEWNNTLLNAFKLVTAKTNDNLAKHYQKMMDSAAKYITERCCPDWWQNKRSIAFNSVDPLKSINIKSGVIHLYPRDIKTCEFKRYNPHRGNHIYFIIFTNKIFGNAGFYQKCHSFHHYKKPTSIIHPAYTDDQKKTVKPLFELLQKRTKSYTKHCLMKQYPMVHFPDENNNLSSWIIVSIFVSVFHNFIKSITNEYFSTYNQISNTEMIFKLIDRLISQICYYLEFAKNFTNHKIIFQLVDQIMIEAIVLLRSENIEMADFYIEKYAIYRSYLVQFSLSNMYSTNNFNNLNEKDFVTIIKKYSSLLNPEETTISRRKNNSILYIYQIASLTEKNIHSQYQHVLSSPFEPEVVDEEKFIINKVIEILRPKVAAFLRMNFKYMKLTTEPSISPGTSAERDDPL